MKYLGRIVIVFVLSTLLASGIYMFVNKGQRTYRNEYKKYSEMFNDSTPYDAVMFGSSRTYKNIDPRICDSISGLSFYNAGVAGAKFFEISTIFSAYFEKHKTYPQFVVYNLDELNFATDKSFFNPIIYFDFLDNSTIYNGFKEKKYPVWMYKHIPFLRMLEYNDDTRNNSLKGLRGQVNAEDKTVNGYSKMEFETFKKLNSSSFGSIKIGNYKKNNYFNSMLDFCKNNGIQIVFISSPVFDHYYNKKINNYDLLIKDFETFTSSNNYPFWRFDSLEICKSQEYFGDDVHLNRKGTNIFTALFAAKMKELVNVSR